jgi:hypothetical protein
MADFQERSISIRLQHHHRSEREPQSRSMTLFITEWVRFFTSIPFGNRPDRYV